MGPQGEHHQLDFYVRYRHYVGLRKGKYSYCILFFNLGADLPRAEFLGGQFAATN